MHHLGHMFHRRGEQPEQKAEQQPESNDVTFQGRRYRTDVAYPLPKDRPEEERIFFQHRLLKQIMQGNYIAPIDTRKVTNILDVGAGMGAWGHDVAREMKQAKVVGFDIEQARVTGLLPPPNYSFIMGNVLEGLPFPSDSFDFVHQRLLMSAIPGRAWPYVLQEYRRILRPGGFVEICEAGDTYLPHTLNMQQFTLWGRVACAQRGIDIDVARNFDTLLQRIGFGNIHKRTLRIGLGAWAGRNGSMLATDTYAAFQGLKALHGLANHLTPVEVDKVVAALPEEWEKYHVQHEWYVTYAQKDL